MKSQALALNYDEYARMVQYEMYVGARSGDRERVQNSVEFCGACVRAIYRGVSENVTNQNMIALNVVRN